MIKYTEDFSHGSLQIRSLTLLPTWRTLIKLFFETLNTTFKREGKLTKIRVI